MCDLTANRTPGGVFGCACVLSLDGYRVQVLVACFCLGDHCLCTKIILFTAVCARFILVIDSMIVRGFLSQPHCSWTEIIYFIRSICSRLILVSINSTWFLESAHLPFLSRVKKSPAARHSVLTRFYGILDGNPHSGTARGCGGPSWAREDSAHGRSRRPKQVGGGDSGGELVPMRNFTMAH